VGPVRDELRCVTTDRIVGDGIRVQDTARVDEGATIADGDSGVNATVYVIVVGWAT
jgi:hypothetical protein